MVHEQTLFSKEYGVFGHVYSAMYVQPNKFSKLKYKKKCSDLKSNIPTLVLSGVHCWVRVRTIQRVLNHSYNADSHLIFLGECRCPLPILHTALHSQH